MIKQLFIYFLALFAIYAVVYFSVTYWVLAIPALIAIRRYDQRQKSKE